MVNSTTISGIVVTPIMEHDLKGGGTYLSLRLKNESKKGAGRITEKFYVRVNIFSDSQKQICRDRGLEQGDRVWVYGELMARNEDDTGRDIIEIRAHQLDRVVEG